MLRDVGYRPNGNMPIPERTWYDVGSNDGAFKPTNNMHLGQLPTARSGWDYEYPPDGSRRGSFIYAENLVMSAS